MDAEVVVIEAELANPQHQEAIVMLLNAYASDPMGGGRALSEDVRAALIPGLQRHPTSMIFLAWCGPQPWALPCVSSVSPPLRRGRC